MKNLIFLIALALPFAPTFADEAEKKDEDKVPAILLRTDKAVEEFNENEFFFEPAEATWKREVTEGVNYLYTRQNDILDKQAEFEERLSKIEATMIKVETDKGVVAREIPITNGSGSFVLKPGETLAGYQDPVTGKWVSVSSPKSVVTYGFTTAGARVARPTKVTATVSTYSTPTTVVETQVTKSRTRGSLFLRRPSVTTSLSTYRSSGPTCRVVNGQRICTP